MMTNYQHEQLAIQWSHDEGWNCAHGGVIVPEDVAPEREDFRAIVLNGRLAKTELGPEIRASG